MSLGLGHQRGASFIGILLTLVILGFLITLSMRLVPPYIDYYELRSLMNEIAHSPHASNEDFAQLWDVLSQRMAINNINGITRKDFSLKRNISHRILGVKYQMIRPLTGNVDMLIHFQYAVSIPGQGGYGG